MSLYEDIEYLPTGDCWYIVGISTEEELMNHMTTSFVEWMRENNVTRVTYGREEQHYINVDDVLFSLI